MSTVRIPLRDRHGVARAFAIVDSADAKELNRNRWCLNNNGYAVRGRKRNGKTTLIPMHRQILGLEPGDRRQVDHINGDRLDNRRANLRIVTNAQNAQNRKPTGRHRGVAFHKASGRYRAEATLAGQTRSLGYFDTPEEAAEAASRFRAEHMPYSNDARAA